MEIFSQYQPLFSDAINQNRIGVCKWNEAGTTIDTALPELVELTDDKEEWRAIIVRYVDDEGMSAFETAPQNPYDFLVNQDGGVIAESPIPLVRLTHMLGGIPPLEVQFAAEILREPYKAPRTIYVPVEDQQRKQAHQKLVEQYRYDGKLPSSILLISVRDKQNKEASIDHIWMPHKESDSSEFWKRNQFPSICRFMVFDFEQQGAMQREADNFCFWYSVMLMSVNEWDSSTIQAYRLYSLKLNPDRGAMAECFQEYGDRLRDMRQTLKKSIRKDIENQVCQEEALPDYRIDIPVSLKLPKVKERGVKTSSFPVLSKGSATDVAIWTGQREAAEEELVHAVRSAERTLDQTADRMRSRCVVDEAETLPLNRYQVEDLSRETRELYHQVVKTQGELPKENIAADAEMQELAENVRLTLLGRVMKRPAILSAVIVAVLLLLAAMPAVVEHIRQGTGSLRALWCVLLGITCSVLVSGIVVLLIQKLRLNLRIKRYDQKLKDLFNRLVENAGDYSDYMSGIASYARGVSYLEHSARIHHHSHAQHDTKYIHIQAIDKLLSRVSVWCKAFHLSVDLTSPRPDNKVDIDLSVPPAENKLYEFESGACYPVSINQSGMMMQSPYCFANQIVITREELYEDE